MIDADQRENPKDRHKAHRRARRHQRQDHADQPHSGATLATRNIFLHTVQLDHQEGRHEEQHQRHHLGNRPLGLAALLHRTAGDHLVTRRQAGGELVDIGLQLLDQIGRLQVARAHRP